MRKLKKIIGCCIAIIVIGLLILFLDEKLNQPDDEDTAIPAITITLDQERICF